MKITHSQQEQQNLRKLDLLIRKNINCVKIHPQNSLAHEYSKWAVSYWLSLQGLKFVSEVKFSNGKRADIYCYSNDTAYEIVTTEKEESKLRKEGCYPCNIKFIHSSDVLGLEIEELYKILN